MNKAEQALHDVLHDYLSFEVAGKHIKIPYIITKKTMQYWKSSGKGSPIVLKRELEFYAQKHRFNLETETAGKIYQFMKKHQIGVDCSGFAYHLLDAYAKVAINQSLSKVLLRKDGIFGVIDRVLWQYKRERRMSVKVLTSDVNSIVIEQVTDIRIGDLIRVSGTVPGDHVLVVVDRTYDSSGELQQITYAHSSGKSMHQQGPHLAHILINDAALPLEQQSWSEEMADGSFMDRYHPEWGDRVRRLKSLAMG